MIRFDDFLLYHDFFIYIVSCYSFSPAYFVQQIGDSDILYKASTLQEAKDFILECYP